MVPWYNGAKASHEEKEKLWDKYDTGATVSIDLNKG